MNSLFVFPPSDKPHKNIKIERRMPVVARLELPPAYCAQIMGRTNSGSSVSETKIAAGLRGRETHGLALWSGAFYGRPRVNTEAWGSCRMVSSYRAPTGALPL
jgi:hypothetical protein